VSNRISRLAISALTALGIAAPVEARTHFVAPDQAPASWVAYAKVATATLTGLVNSDDKRALQVRAAMQPAQAGSSAPALIIKVWLGADGTLRRVDFASLGAAETDQNLHGLLEGRQLPVPPKGMRQPLKLALQPQSQPVSSGASTDALSAAPGGMPGAAHSETFQ
jgi:hypothetical protein